MTTVVFHRASAQTGLRHRPGAHWFKSSSWSECGRRKCALCLPALLTAGRCDSQQHTTQSWGWNGWWWPLKTKTNTSVMTRTALSKQVIRTLCITCVQQNQKHGHLSICCSRLCSPPFWGDCCTRTLGALSKARTHCWTEVIAFTQKLSFAKTFSQAHES